MPDPACRAYDLVIVGASFAGLVAAKTAAMRGLSVAVMDTKPEAGHRVASTGILVKEAVEEIDIPFRLTRRVHGVRLYGPSLRHIDLFAPGYYFLTTDTADLLRWLAKEALRAGAHILFRTRFAGATRHDGRFRLHGHNIEGRYILGADGARSSVARHFGLGTNTRFLTGHEVEYEGLAAADPRFLHCFLDPRFAPGYLGWIAPGPTVTQVGLAVGHGRRPDLARFRLRTDGIFHYGASRIVGHRVGRIPCGGLVAPWATPGVMLIGDAAGQVSPATGGGIRLAFAYGRKAALAIADHLKSAGPPPHMALEHEMPRFAAKLALRWLLDRALPPSVMDLALATAPMRFLAQRIYFHRRGAGGQSFAAYEAELERMAKCESRSVTGRDAGSASTA